MQSCHELLAPERVTSTFLFQHGQIKLKSRPQSMDLGSFDTPHSSQRICSMLGTAFRRGTSNLPTQPDK